MRIQLPVLAIALLTAAAVAQSTHQYIGLDGFATSFTARTGLGKNAGEIHQGFHSSHFRGLGENAGHLNPNGKCELTRLILLTQDQNASTRETYDFVVRSGDDNTGPTAGTAGVLGELTGLRLPNSGKLGAAAWRITYTLAASARIQLPCDKFFSFGSRLPPSPNWAQDGQSIHTCYGSGKKKHQNTWLDDGNSNNPNHAWHFGGTSTIAKQPGSHRTWRFFGSTFGPVMRLGCGTNGGTGVLRPSPGGYGMGGMFPKTSVASIPLAFQARLNGGSAMVGAATVAVLSLLPTNAGGWFPVTVPFGTGARLYISTSSIFLFFGPRADASGMSVIPLAPFLPNLGNTTRLTFPIQGGMDSPGTGLRLTNAQAVTPQ